MTVIYNVEEVSSFPCLNEFPRFTSENKLNTFCVQICCYRSSFAKLQNI
nr:MAG TPA: hypothetical protein [Caudoviricetes sp.]